MTCYDLLALRRILALSIEVTPPDLSKTDLDEQNRERCHESELKP
jgi:hypothetical protein